MPLGPKQRPREVEAGLSKQQVLCNLRGGPVGSLSIFPNVTASMTAFRRELCSLRDSACVPAWVTNLVHRIFWVPIFYFVP